MDVYIYAKVGSSLGNLDVRTYFNLVSTTAVMLQNQEFGGLRPEFESSSSSSSQTFSSHLGNNKAASALKSRSSAGPKASDPTANSATKHLSFNSR